MAWLPISLTPVNYVVSGVPASGKVLKAYQSGTSTPISFATDSGGGTQAATITLNSDGYPQVSGNLVIPHVEETFKLALYPNQAAADANSGANWTVDGLTPISNVAFGNSVNEQTVTYTLQGTDKGKLIYYSGAGGVTIDLLPAEDAGDGFAFMVENDTSGTVTIDGDGAEQVNGATTAVIAAGSFAIVVCDGTAWRALIAVESGSFTATLTGMTTTIQGTINWSRTGNVVTLFRKSTDLTGTSNANTFTLTGLPANLTPPDNYFAASCVGSVDNSVATGLARAAVLVNSTIQFSLFDGSAFSTTGWTTSGSKGLGTGWTMTYDIGGT